MPHGGGGGSSGGGFHGGSSGGSSGSSYPRTSRRPFKGATCYVYYGYHNNPKVIYCEKDPRGQKSALILPLIITSVMVILEPTFVLISSNHNPTKLEMDYSDTTSTIIDRSDVISDAEEIKIISLFDEFKDKTGITPALMTVHNTEWTGELVNYAYDQYVTRWTDEKHMLVVYSSNLGSAKDNWSYEMMQGNDTDHILYEDIKDRHFHPILCESLDNSSYTVGEAFIKTMETFLPNVMKKEFYIEPSLIFFSVVWELICIGALISVICSFFTQKAMKDAVALPEGSNLKLKKCPTCGSSYYEGTLGRCRKCGRDLSYIEEEEDLDNF